MKVLITGAAGQIGSDLVPIIRDFGHEVIETDLAYDEETEARRSLDITDADACEALFRELKPNWVIHLAALLSAKGEKRPDVTYAINLTATKNLFDRCREHGVERIGFASTIAVYGPSDKSVVSEEDARWPTTMYGVTKAACENLAQYYRGRFDQDIRCIRFPGLISDVPPGGGTSDYVNHMYIESVAGRAYQAFCRANTRIPIMYMPDAVRAVAELMMAPKGSLTKAAYNISAFSPTAQEFRDSILKEIPTANLTFESVQARQDILDSWPDALDDSAARSDWGWNPQYDLDAMTRDLVKLLKRK